MSGVENRKIFFNDRNLDIIEGYRLLSGGTPSLKDIDVDGFRSTTGPELVKQIHLLSRKESVNEGTPIYYIFHSPD